MRKPNVLVERRLYRALLVTLVALMVCLVAAPPASATHQEVVYKLDRGEVELVSLTEAGTPSDEHSARRCGPNDPIALSDDGRYVVFTSKARLVEEDVNGSLLTDVYRRDRLKDVTELVSAGTDGTSLGGAEAASGQLDSLCFDSTQNWAFSPSISGNGRYVAFASYGNLTKSEETPSSDQLNVKVFVRDMKRDVTEMASVTLSGEVPNGDSGFDRISISEDGARVAFTSVASDILADTDPGCENDPATALIAGCAEQQVYVRDLKRDRTMHASITKAGTRSNGPAYGPSISDDGRFVAFESTATDLTPEIDRNLLCMVNPSWTKSCPDVYVRDLDGESTELISISRDGRAGDHQSHLDASGTNGQMLSEDGRFVLFSSMSSDLVPTSSGYGAVAPNIYLFVRDRKTNRTERVSITNVGTSIGGIFPGGISDDGKFAMFRAVLCDGQNCLDQKHQTQAGAVIYNRETGQLDMHRAQDKNTPNSSDHAPYLSGDATTLGWASPVDGIVEGDANGVTDVFVQDLGNPGRGIVAGSADTRPVPSRSAGSIEAVPSGARVTEGIMALRPEADDLYIRLNTDRLPVATTTGQTLLPLRYHLRFSVSEVDYEFRATPSLMSTLMPPLYELWSRGEGSEWDRLTAVDGSYGTTGESITASIPLTALSLDQLSEISNPLSFVTFAE